MNASNIGSKTTRRAAVAAVAGLMASATVNIPKNVIEVDDAQIAAKIKTEGTQTRTALIAATVHGIQTPDDPIQTALNAQSVQEGSAFGDIAKRAGVDNTGATECAAAIQAAINGVNALGQRAYAKGTFLIGSTVTIQGDVDFTDAVFQYNGPAGVAIRVGKTTSGDMSRKNIKLPHLEHVGKTAGDTWQSVAGAIGFEIANTVKTEIAVPQARNFETGLQLCGYSGGVGYNNIYLGYIVHNKRNIRFTNVGTGWTNQNNFYGGRVAHFSGIGTESPGTRHILIENTSNAVNANTFWGTSLESPNLAEYHVDAAGFDNQFINCRWENTGAPARVIWRAGGYGNAIVDGYGANLITEIFEAGTYQNNSSSRSHKRFSGGPGSARALMTLRNTTSSGGAGLRIMPADAGDPAQDGTNWAWDISANQCDGKTRTAPHAQLSLRPANGRIYVGDGSAAPAAYFGRVLDGVGFGGGHLYANPNNTQDIGNGAYKPRYVRAATGIQTATFTTANRPAVTTTESGAMIVDTTLGKPIWYIGGKGWVDATGASV